MLGGRPSSSPPVADNYRTQFSGTAKSGSASRRRMAIVGRPSRKECNRATKCLTVSHIYNSQTIALCSVCKWERKALVRQKVRSVVR